MGRFSACRSGPNRRDPPQFQHNNLFSFNDDVTYIHGRGHTFKSGFLGEGVYRDNRQPAAVFEWSVFSSTPSPMRSLNNPLFFLDQAAENGTSACDSRIMRLTARMIFAYLRHG